MASANRNAIKPVQTIAKLIGNLIFIFLLVLLCALVFLLVQSRISGGPPTVSGYRLFAVLSGSMSPEFETGSLVVVKPVDPAALHVGDIITFGNADGQLVTHRIIGIENDGDLSFITKGDANEVADSEPVPAHRVVGMMALAIPWLGRILVFSQTKKGILLMIAIPSLLILVLEARSLWRFAAEEDKKRAAQAEQGESTQAEKAEQSLFSD
ncbi:MAG: signal peptidase I [Bacillota bacterium]|jgi:signal peptidase